MNPDVVVRIDRPLENEARDRLELALLAEPGVRRVRANPRSGQLYVVSYDPSAISALGLLRCLQAQGFAASLIGM
jgi:hypothetical protein